MFSDLYRKNNKVLRMDESLSEYEFVDLKCEPDIIKENQSSYKPVYRQ